MNTAAEPSVTIIGGGVSGLATAFFLKQAGLRSTLIEKSPRLGGLIRTDVIQDCQLEAGPDSYIANKTSVTELAGQLDGLHNDIIGSNDSQRRVYIVRDNRFLPMPPSMSMMVPGDMKAAIESPLFSSLTKARFLLEVFTAPKHRTHDFSVRELVTDHFGPEILEYITEPLLSGVYGGDSAQLSAESVLPRFVGYERTYGSLIRGVRREQQSQAQQAAKSLFLGFRGGMQSLTDALAHAISGSVDVLHQEVSSIVPDTAGWLVRCPDQELKTNHVVLAVPAYSAAALLADSASALSTELAAIPYSSAILVTLIYRKEQVHIPEGFGFLVPRSERKTIAATTFIGTKWPGRIPPELVALRAFIVDPEAPRLLAHSNQDLLAGVQADYNRLLDINADPLFSTLERWPNSMPQYVVGHGQRQKQIAYLLSELEGLHLTGNAYDGVGVPDCVRLAREIANSIANQGNAGPQLSA